MLKIIHRVNTVKELQNLSNNFGVEVDVRTYNNKLILQHEPYKKGELLETYLREYNHKYIIFNVKTAGIEADIITLANKYNISNYFLLDVEFPYLYTAARSGIKNIAIRFSEDESIRTVQRYKSMIEWVWVDTMSTFPVNKTNVKVLDNFKTCLVCPERWGRPEDIDTYKELMKEIEFYPNAIMTSLAYVSVWEK